LRSRTETGTWKTTDHWPERYKRNRHKRLRKRKDEYRYWNTRNHKEKLRQFLKKKTENTGKRIKMIMEFQIRVKISLFPKDHMRIILRIEIFKQENQIKNVKRLEVQKQELEKIDKEKIIRKKASKKVRINDKVG
jgi:hypothetical protein